MSLKIEFIPAFEKILDLDISPPKPSSQFIPEWYKSLNIYLNKDCRHVRDSNNLYNFSAKACMPIIDSLTSGYIITTPCELEFVDPSTYGHRVLWEWDHPVITTHNEQQVKGLSMPGFELNPLKFQGIWRVRLPKNYSLLYTHPFWHWDLPFMSTTGIVDSDKHDLEINIPFFIKKDFFGTIEKNTPIAQIIPIKREVWKSSVLPFDKNVYSLKENMSLYNSRFYKRKIWTKKKYL